MDTSEHQQNHTASFSWGHVLVAVVVGVFIYKLIAAPPTASQEGMKAVDIPLQSVSDGRKWTPRWKGRVTVLEFWARWCSVCMSKLTASTRRAHRFQKQGIQYLMVNLDQPFSNQQIRRVLKSRAISRSMWNVHHWDRRGRAMRAFSVRMLPSTVVIDRSGRIVNYFRGTVSNRLLQAYVTKALQAKPTSTQKTVP